MGVVRKQSIHSSIYIYLGFAFGAFNFWLLPKILTTEEFGLIRILISVCTLLGGLCSLGTLQVITRFYPYYQNDPRGRKNDLLGWSVLISILGFTLMAILTIGFKGLFIRKFEGNSPLFVDYFYLIYPFTFFILLFGIYERIAWSKQVTIFSSFLRETGIRIFTMIIVILLLLRWINFNSFIILYSLQFGVVFVVLYVFLTFRRGTHLSLQITETTRKNYRQMITYAGFIVGGGMFMLVEQNFNTILLGSRSSLTTAGIFDLANFMATLLLVPKRSMQAAASATIATALKDMDMHRIARVYVKSCATLLIIGMLILGLIWLNIDHLFTLYKPEYKSGKYIVLIVGVANLVDMATGLNYDILVNSKLWKLHFYISVGLVAFFLPVTYFLVRLYGMMGSAYGILLSLTVYNIIRCLLLWWKYKIQPFSYKTGLILLCGIVAYMVPATLVPRVDNLFIDSIIRSAIFTVLLGAGIIGGKLSDDITELYRLTLTRLKLNR